MAAQKYTVIMGIIPSPNNRVLSWKVFIIVLQPGAIMIKMATSIYY